eukprot:2190871-Amphidinium_carterae.1
MSKAKEKELRDKLAQLEKQLLDVQQENGDLEASCSLLAIIVQTHSKSLGLGNSGFFCAARYWKHAHTPRWTRRQSIGFATIAMTACCCLEAERAGAQ